jgi:hypothetical protein
MTVAILAATAIPSITTRSAKVDGLSSISSQGGIGFAVISTPLDLRGLNSAAFGDWDDQSN